jgi:hypothetical protein
MRLLEELTKKEEKEIVDSYLSSKEGRYVDHE